MNTKVENKPEQEPETSALERIFVRARLEICPARCLRLRHKKSTCQLCRQNCPRDAISFNETLEVDFLRCHGCGICANLCPTEVFQLKKPSYQALLPKTVGRSEIRFACSLLPEQKENVAVPCLGYLNEAVLIAIIARGTQTVTLDVAHCKNCELTLGSQIAMRTVQKANSVLSLFGLSGKIRATTGIPNSNGLLEKGLYSRRELFSNLGLGIRHAVAGASDGPTTEEEREGKLRNVPAPRVPEKRSLLLESLKHLGEPINTKAEVNDLPFARIEIGQGCDGCAMCATFCPTGALRLRHDDQKRAIDFIPGLCLACNLCRDICPQGVIASLAYISLNDIMTGSSQVLIEHGESACSQCGRAFIAAGGSSLCPNCKKTKEMKEWLLTRIR